MDPKNVVYVWWLKSEEIPNFGNDFNVCVVLEFGVAIEFATFNARHVRCLKIPWLSKLPKWFTCYWKGLKFLLKGFEVTVKPL